MITILLIFSILFFVGYLISLIIPTIKFYLKLGLKNINPFIEETVDVPNYEPAIMGYLVNYQKIGKREVCSTLFDLISKGNIKLDLKKGLVSDDKGEYILTKKSADNLKSYEQDLIDYLYGENNQISEKILASKLYKKNLDKDFYIKFLKNIQKEAKKKNFFDKKTAKRKTRIYKVVNKIVTVIASIASGLFALSLNLLEYAEDFEVVVGLLGLMLVAGIFWVIKFLISFFYNITCYYNSFSKKGNEDYKKWLGFRRYLKKWSSLTNQPMMAVTIWKRYYAYSIGLKVNKKFFRQIKKMKIMDNSIDIKTFEMFNEIVSCIGTSAKKIKSVSIDRYGGSHVDY